MWVCLPKTPSELKTQRFGAFIRSLCDHDELSFRRPFRFVASSFRTRAARQAEILALRHQLAVFQKNAPRRLRFHRSDRFLWVLLSRWCPVGGVVCTSSDRVAPPGVELRLASGAIAVQLAEATLAISLRLALAILLPEHIRAVSQDGGPPYHSK